jgi:hypothetical protein
VLCRGLVSCEAAKPRRDWRGAGGELSHPCRIRSWLSAAFVARAFQPEPCAYEHLCVARPQCRMTAVILNHEWARTDTILSRITEQMESLRTACGAGARDCDAGRTLVRSGF